MSERTERRVTPAGRWSPFSELDLFALDPWRPSRMRSLFSDPTGESAPARAFSPAVDVTENDDEYRITAELAGAKKDDVTLELHDDVLTVRGEKRDEREQERDHARYVERRFGSFSRTFTLPANADGEKLKASFEDGVLTIRIPKQAEAKPKQIAIQ